MVSETWKDVRLAQDMTREQWEEVWSPGTLFQDILMEYRGSTDLAECPIFLTNRQPVKETTSSSIA